MHTREREQIHAPTDIHKPLDSSDPFRSGANAMREIEANIFMLLAAQLNGGSRTSAPLPVQLSP